MKLLTFAAAVVLFHAGLSLGAPAEERCGPEHFDRKCSKDRCCSHAGFCGTGPDFCNVPWKCLPGFGRCDSDNRPPGPSTAKDIRPNVGIAPFAVPITHCKEAGTVAITYDDGPSVLTHSILNMLKQAEAKATFFVSGIVNGKGEIDLEDQWKQDIRRMEAEGHQVGSHTWSHFDLDKLSSEERRDEMYKNERAIANILGKYPVFMRAPYIRCGAECLGDMKALGYKVVQWSVDSKDTERPTDLEAMKKAIDAGFAKAGPGGGILFIQHDTLPVSAISLTQHILGRIKEKQWKAVTVAECLGESLDDAYRKKEPAKGLSAGV